jgi:hypothetical protein
MAVDSVPQNVDCMLRYGEQAMKQCDILEKMINLSPESRARTSKVVARSFFRILSKNGFTHSDIMDFAGNLLDEVMGDMKEDGQDSSSSSEISVVESIKSRDVA